MWFDYVSDIVQGVIASMFRRLKNEVINIGFGTPVTIVKIIMIIENDNGEKAQIDYLPKQKGDVDITFVDIKR